MIELLSFISHAWFKGHSVEVIKYNTALATRGSRKGWYYCCDCGKAWTR